MKDFIASSEVHELELKVGFHLINKGLAILESTSEDVSNDYKVDTINFSKSIEEVSTMVSELKLDYISNKQFRGYLPEDIVNMLHSQLTEIKELNELDIMLKDIFEILTKIKGKITEKDARTLEPLLNRIEEKADSDALDAILFSKGFLEQFPITTRR